MSAFLVSPRNERGEKPKHLRKKGLVPMAFIGRDHATHAIQASVVALRDAVQSADSHGVIEMQIEGESGTRKAMLKSVQGDHLARTVLSATFQEVADDDTVKTELPVVASGHNEELDGEALVLNAVTTTLKVRGKVSSLPESIVVDVSHLGVGHHITAGEIALPDGVELMTPADATVFTVNTVAEPVLVDPDVVTEAEPEEAAATEEKTEE